MKEIEDVFSDAHGVPEPMRNDWKSEGFYFIRKEKKGKFDCFCFGKRERRGQGKLFVVLFLCGLYVRVGVCLCVFVPRVRRACALIFLFFCVLWGYRKLVELKLHCARALQFTPHNLHWSQLHCTCQDAQTREYPQQGTLTRRKKRKKRTRHAEQKHKDRRPRVRV